MSALSRFYFLSSGVQTSLFYQTGMIKSSEDMLFVQPLPTHLAKRVRRSAHSTPHLIYRATKAKQVSFGGQMNKPGLYVNILALDSYSEKLIFCPRRTSIFNPYLPQPPLFRNPDSIKSNNINKCFCGTSRMTCFIIITIRSTWYQDTNSARHACRMEKRLPLNTKQTIFFILFCLFVCLFPKIQCATCNIMQNTDGPENQHGQMQRYI